MGPKPKKMEIVPLRVVVKKGSRAADRYTDRAGLDPEALAPGLKPSPKQDLIFHGGKTIQHLSYLNCYVAGQTAWAASDIQNVDRALAAAMSDNNLNNVVMQYFKNQPVTSKSLPSRKLAGNAPSLVSQGDAEAMIVNLQQQGALAGLDLGSTLINLLLPQGTILTDDAGPSSAEKQAAAKLRRAIPVEDEASSQEGLGGYHGSVHSNGATIYYAIGVYSEQTANGANGIPAFDQPWKNIVATFYHELNEARTDADVEDAIRTNKTTVLGWTSKQGEEIGDFPVDETNGNLSKVFKEVPLADGSGTVPIQLLYSNAVHGPEGPINQPHPIT